MIDLLTRYRVQFIALGSLLIGALVMGARVPQRAPREILPVPNANASIGFIELTGEGAIRDHDQMNRVVQTAERLAFDKGTILVIFIHGWNSDCQDCTSGVECFAEVLRALSRLQQSFRGAQARDVFGVYISWPATVLRPLWLNKAVTFWNRINTAKRVGQSGQLNKLLEELRKRTTDRNRYNPMIIAAHSMGARVLFEALKPRISQIASGLPSTPIADLIALVNPAFSAIDYKEIHDAQVQRSWSELTAQAPTILIAGSETDLVTKYLYPAGSIVVGNWSSLTHSSITNYSQFFTHKVRVYGDLGTRENRASTCACPTVTTDQIASKFPHQDGNGDFDFEEWRHYFEYQHINRNGADIRFEPRSQNSGPIWVVSLDHQVVDGHFDFFSPVFIDLLTRMINYKLFRDQVP